MNRRLTLMCLALIVAGLNLVMAVHDDAPWRVIFVVLCLGIAINFYRAWARNEGSEI